MRVRVLVKESGREREREKKKRREKASKQDANEKYGLVNSFFFKAKKRKDRRQKGGVGRWLQKALLRRVCVNVTAMQRPLKHTQKRIKKREVFVGWFQKYR